MCHLVWRQGKVLGIRRFLICERCAATVPPPVVEPGVQLVEVEADFDQAH